MNISQAADAIVSSALQLTPDERAAIADALLVSIPLEDVDHGPKEADEVVRAAWEEEISQRVEDIDAGRVKTISAEDAERMIRKK